MVLCRLGGVLSSSDVCDTSLSLHQGSDSKTQYTQDTFAACFHYRNIKKAGWIGEVKSGLEGEVGGGIEGEEDHFAGAERKDTIWQEATQDQNDGAW